MDNDEDAASASFDPDRELSSTFYLVSREDKKIAPPLQSQDVSFSDESLMLLTQCMWYACSMPKYAFSMPILAY